MSIYQFAEDKSKLFAAVILSVIGILIAPIIIPNLFHGTHIVHIGLHIGGMVTAIFLTMATIVAYAKMRTKRLGFTAFAFSFFIMAEVIALIDITWPFTFYLGDITLREIEHLLIISMLGIFTLAVFRND
ncbi:MAG TPA: hypothetical protein VNL34_04650 [Candidatus Nitrosotenuis sp.]|nr:hypothetical protein [Candidatus Nitrosotenuis sp.]